MYAWVRGRVGLLNVGGRPVERLLPDALGGDPLLFTRDDSVEAAWGVIEPALAGLSPVQRYEPGTWRPPAAAGVVAGGERWHDPKPEETAPC